MLLRGQAIEWEEPLSIPIWLVAISFTGVWLEIKMATHMNNGAVETVDRFVAPSVSVYGNTAAPPFFVFGFKRV